MYFVHHAGCHYPICPICSHSIFTIHSNASCPFKSNNMSHFKCDYDRHMSMSTHICIFSLGNVFHNQIIDFSSFLSLESIHPPQMQMMEFRHYDDVSLKFMPDHASFTLCHYCMVMISCEFPFISPFLVDF